MTAKNHTSLTDLIGAPERVTDIPPTVIPPLLIELAAQQAALAALQNALAARLLAGSQDKWGQGQLSEDDQLVTVTEAAKRLAMNRHYVYGLIRQGQFPAVRQGRHVRIRIGDLHEWITQHR